MIDENPAIHHYPGDFPEGKEWPVVDDHEGIFYGYRGYDRARMEPLFPFGSGLSYTSFALSGMVAVRSPSADGYTVTLTLSNTGKLLGATVVQLYLSLPGESTPRPLRELNGFQRVELKPGETQKVTITLPDASLLYWHPARNCWVPPEGKIQLEAGFSERDILQEVTLPNSQVDKNL